MMIWIWNRGPLGFDCFTRRFEKKRICISKWTGSWRQRWQPTTDCVYIPDLTAEEVGQLMGGN